MNVKVFQFPVIAFSVAGWIKEPDAIQYLEKVMTAQSVKPIEIVDTEIVQSRNDDIVNLRQSLTRCNELAKPRRTPCVENVD